MILLQYTESLHKYPTMNTCAVHVQIPIKMNVNVENQHMHMYMHMPAFVRVYMPSKYRSEAAKASFYELVAICRAVRVCTCKWT